MHVTLALIGSSPENRSERFESLPGERCPHCSENCVSESKAIQCDLCGVWAHAECEGISVELYDKFNAVCANVNNVSYYCEANHCNSRIKQLVHAHYANLDQQDTKLQSVDSKLSEKICNLSQKITNIEAKLQDYHKSVLRNCDTAEEGVYNQSQGLSRSPLSDDSVVNITLSLTSEQKEKERRQFNVVLHNLKESDASDSVTRKQDDIESCCSLFSTYLSVSASIKSAIRLGKRGSRPCRLLKLTLGSLDEKAKILKHKMKLKAEQNPEHVRKIYISPDLTPLEQRRNNALRKQLDEMNKIQNIYVIRKGQIVRKYGSNVPARTSMSPFVSESNDNGSRTAS